MESNEIYLAPRSEKIDLDGPWNFVTNPDGKLTLESLPAEMRTINVPGCWESQFPDLIEYDGLAWYQRRVRIPPEWAGKRILLRFNAVDYSAEVWVNNEFVGQHDGGYLPFFFEIQDSVHAGEENVITVSVNDVHDLTLAPHGKQSWYCNIGGIWQSVWLEKTEDTYLTGIWITPDVANSKALIRVKVAHVPGDVKGLKLTFKITSPDGSKSWSNDVEVAAGQTQYGAEIYIKDVELWDLDSPSLYTSTVELSRNGVPVDSTTTNFGMRTVEAKDNKIYLNGRPIYVRGALDQAFYPGTIYTPASDEFLRDQFEKAKYMGLNLLRVHVKIPDPRYLYWADRLGLLIWQDLPNWGRLTEETMEIGRKTLEGMIMRDYNHPSIIIWNVINEAWGIDINSARDREWLVQMFDFAKQLDPTRLVVDNSPCAGNYHVKTDLEDYHMYINLPDHYDMYRAWVKDFASHPEWTIRGTPTGQEPLILSEFGYWGLPKLTDLTKFYGGDPWWFEKYARDPIKPGNVRDRFRETGLQAVFGSFDEFALATQKHQFEMLKQGIEELRKYSSIQGYVITEFTDLTWECNGLLDFLRNPKVFHDELGKINADDVVLVDWNRVSYWVGETFSASVIVSHYSPIEIKDCTVEWALEDTDIKGVFKGVSVLQSDTKTIGKIEFTLPPVPDSTKCKLKLELRDVNGDIIASNYLTLDVFPSEYKWAQYTGMIGVYDPLGILWIRMTEAKYNVRARFLSRLHKDVQYGVVTTIDDHVLNYVKNGGTVFLVGHPSMTISLPDSKVEITFRSGLRMGDWASSFNWVRPHQVFHRVPFEGILGFESLGVAPECIIEGLLSEHVDDVFAGITVAWINESACLAGQFKIGKGKVLVTTFNLLRNFRIDPVATIMMHDMINYMTSENFNPQGANS